MGSWLSRISRWSTSTYGGGLDRGEVIDRMVASFANRYGLKPGSISPATVDLAEARVTAKFGTEDWLTRVP